MTDSTVRAAADMMQVVDLILAAAILFLSVWALRRWRQARALLVGLVTVAAHGVVFHAATLAGAVMSPWVNLWSATLRAHIEALLLATGNLALVVGAAIVAGWLLYNRLRQVPPSTYSEMEQTLADMNRQMSELRQQQAADHTEMRRLRGEITRIDAALQEWTERFLALAREFREETGKEPNTRPPSPPASVAAPPSVAIVTPSPAANEAALLRLMCETFDLDEVDGLVFEMGLGRNVRGNSIENRARSLISAAQRRGRLPELIELCRRERPNGGF
jgi:hypothetical protein